MVLLLKKICIDAEPNPNFFSSSVLRACLEWSDFEIICDSNFYVVLNISHENHGWLLEFFILRTIWQDRLTPLSHSRKPGAGDTAGLQCE